MTRVLSSLAAALMTFLLAGSVLAETADDDWVGTLLVARDELDKGIAQIDREVAAIPERIASDDWRVFPTESGQVVQVDLRVLEDYVSIAQVIAGHPEIKPLLLDALKQANPDVWAAVAVAEHVGGIENMPPADVVALVRTFYTQNADAKRDAYAAHQAKLKAERDDLAKLRADIQQELDALARAAGASASPEASLGPSPSAAAVPSSDLTPEPSLEPSVEPTPGMESEGIQYDAFEGLEHCADDDPACVEARSAPESEGDELQLPSIPPTEIEVLPSAVPSPALDPGPSTEPTDIPEPSSAPSSEPTPGMESEGVQYDALEGLTQCEEDEPMCDAADAEPLGDPTIVCQGEFADALEAPYTSLSAAQIGACFDDCQDWVSWHGSFGDTLPGWCSGETVSPSEQPDERTEPGWCWDDYGQWKLWGEAQGDPLCEGVETP